MILKNIENISHHLRIKTLQFHAMLKSYTPSKINLIKDVFMALHLKEFD